MSVSPPLQAIPAASRRPLLAGAEPREIPLGRIPRAEAAPASAVRDPVAQAGRAPRAMPEPLNSFEGVHNIDGVAPSDVNGDVGLHHYVMMVNVHFCIYDKETGAALIEPMTLSELFAAAGFPAPAATMDDGDPIVLYDHLADRWLLSQFIVSVTPCHQVIAISQTGDPTGAWYLYDFTMPNDKMNDYPHFGVWPDGYYMTDNQFAGNSWGGAGVFAFEREKMLAGDPAATYQYFDLATIDPDYGGLLPADLDGALPPAGAPNYFAMVDDDAWGASPVDTMYVWKFHVDWTDPAGSTFGQGLRPDYTNEVAPFDSAFSGGRDNIPQRGTTQKLDAISDRLMHRLQYRNFGGHESLAVCHTVDADNTDHAGVRYYELRRELPAGAGFVVQEQATFAPDENHRWMGSAALDTFGNLAIGFSVSGTNTYPSIGYAGRMATDPSNGLYQGEATLFAGPAAQTGVNRWGDYSMLAVDPADDTTFWYCNMYSTGGWNWRTRFGSFRLGSPEFGTVLGRVTNSLTGAGLVGARVFATNGYAATARADGSYALNLATGTHYLAASADGFYTSATVPLEILLDETNTLDFGLAPIPLRIVPKTGLTASGMAGGPFAPASQVYLFSNASLSALTWTSAWSSAWLSVSPRRGALAPGETAAVAVQFNAEATFMAPGAYADTVVISNETDGRVETRAVALNVTPYYETLSCEGFDAGLPADWIVLDNAASGAQWRFDDPGRRANLTGGEGGFAIADSDYEGWLDMDTELQSPAMDFRAYPSLACRFKTDYLVYTGTEVADVDVSVGGAAGPWSNLWSKSASLRGPRTVQLDLAAAAGQSNVLLRFHYYNAFWEYWWQVDDVCFLGAKNPNAGDLGIQPPAGLEARGYYPGPFAPERLYRLTNSSGAALTWSASTSAAWFEALPAGGVLAAGAGTVVTARITAAAGTLLPGDYSGQTTFRNETEGLETVRPVSLAVVEPLVIQPAGGFAAAGLEGGPFTPDDQAYALSNPSEQGISWTSTWSSAWLEVAPDHGTLDARSTQQVVVGLADDQLTVPGTYSDRVVFSNLVTHSAFARPITVTVIEITGELDLFDSIDPTNDLAMPFGTVAANLPRREQITVQNSDPPGGRNLIVHDVFFGFYTEDFESGRAPDWRPDVDASWAVADGEYRAQADLDDFMTSVYTGGQVWADAAVQVDIHRDGSAYSSIGLGYRTSGDLDADGVGQGYLFLTASDSYSIWRQNAGSYVALQGWTVSPALKSGATDTNRLLVSAIGTQIRFYVNNTLAWTGADAGLASGTIALLAYNDPADPTTAYFDNVRVGSPRTDTMGLGRKARYLNARPLPGSQPQGLPRGKRPAGLDQAAALLDASPEPAEPFQLAALPAFPATLAPGQSFTFDVTYAPQAPGSNVNVVTIRNNDNDEPWARVDVAGRAAAGALTGRVTAAHSGAPIPRATIVADNGVFQFNTKTDTNGIYRLDLLIGADWTVAATAANYATSTVAGVGIADLLDTTQDFVLTGSLLSGGPTRIEETLPWGHLATNQVCLANSGPFDLEVRIQARPRFSGNAPVAVPPSDGNFPRGPGTPSAGRAPGKLAPGNATEPTAQAPARVLCYGIDMNNSQLVSFYSDDPGTFTVVGYSGADLIPCVDFLNGDFSTLYALDYDAGELVAFDTATAAKTVIGPAAPAAGQSWTGLAADPAGTLFAASTDGLVSKLYQIDPLTGATTTIGDIAGAPGIIAIAINGAGELYGLDLVNDNLIRIDKATGAGTLVGSIGFDANYAQGMDFDEDSDTLYLAAFNNALARGELRIADVQTGNSTLVGVFQDNTEMNIAVASGGGVPWVAIAPESVGIPAGGSACVDVVFDSRGAPNVATSLLARLAFSGNFVNDAFPVELTLHLIPDDLDVTPAEPQTATGLVGGPFAPERFLYGVTNRGTAPLDWTVSHGAAWLDVAPTGGTLAAGAELVVTAALDAAVAALPIGTYTDLVTFVNQSDGIAMPRSVTLKIRPIPPDYFTELFSAGDNDLDFRMLTFTPDASPSFYRACATTLAAFPSDPTGAAPLALDDDSAVEINLVDGAAVQLYGVSYTSLFVGANGYLTFDGADGDFSESLADHFALPRISGLFDDLDPSSGGTVSWTQRVDRVAVTFQNVPEIGAATGNSFQFELFFDGTIRIAWLGLAATDGLAGLSQGLGLATDFGESNLSAYAPCAPGGECAVLISEYVEGSSNNKALEIYNPHAAALDLSAGQFVVQLYMNGGTAPTYNISLNGNVPAQGAFVLAHSSATAAILAVANQTSGNLSFNGNDAVALRVGGTNGPVVDSIGQVGDNPGTEWGSGLTSTADNTLRRRADIRQGDANPADAFNPAVEWEGFAVDAFAGLGSHTNDCTVPPLPTPPVLNPIGNQAVVVGHSLQFQVVATPTDGDAATLTASNLPAGATFASTNEIGTFAWLNAGPTGVYGATFYATDKDGTDEEAISITVDEAVPELLAPVIQAATGVQSNRFNANWLASSNATGYRLDVATNSDFTAGGGVPITNLSENFAGFTTAAGTLDRGATLDAYLQTPGWTGIKIFEDAGRAKIGTSSVLGYIVTPTVDLSANGGTAQLTFDLGKYASDAGLVQVLHAPDGVTFAQVGGDRTPPAAMEVQTLEITGGTALSKIRITAKTATYNRFYLDNVLIFQATPARRFVPGYENLDVGNVTTYAVTGLAQKTTYYYRVKAYNATSNSPYSETTNVATLGEQSSPPVLNAIGNKSVAVGSNLQFQVVAAPTDDDPVTLTASNLPAGATFASTNEIGTFAWLNASPTGVYGATFYATDKDGTDEEAISITVDEAVPELLAPVIQAATGVQSNRFNANWLASANATGYRLDVGTNDTFTGGGTEATLLDENFNAWSGTWINGWTHNSAVQYPTNGLANSRCIGMNAAADWIQTPACTNPGALSFHIRTSSDPGNWTVLVQTSPNGSDWTDRATIVENGAGGTINDTFYQTNVALNLTGTYYVRWYMSSRAADSCYIDNVLIAGAAAGGGGFVPGYENRDAGAATTCAVTGLTANARYYYRVKAYNATSNSPCSGTTSVVTTATMGTPPTLDPIGDRRLFLGEDLAFQVTAVPTEGDAVTLTASNLPAGASFLPTNEVGSFFWTHASPTGIYQLTFTAADKDGRADETIGITVDPLPQFNVFVRSNGAPAYATFPSVAGQDYRLQYSLDLVTNPVAWTQADQAFGTGGMLTLADTNTLADTMRYYRVIAP